MKLRFIKTAQPHDGSQVTMIVRQVLKLVVCVITTKTSSGQHANVPVVHPFATGVRALVFVNVRPDQPKDAIGQS